MSKKLKDSTIKWITIEDEGFPEIDGKYLVVVNKLNRKYYDSKTIADIYVPTVDTSYYENPFGFDSYFDVIAWSEIPVISI